MNPRIAILDRDGTLIDVVRDEETGAITTAFHPNQIVLLADVVEALRVLQDAGFVLAMATNQPGPAKGHFSEAAVKRTNDALVERLAKDGVAIRSVQVCMHHPTIGPCDCRKPKPGMLNAIARDLGADVARSWMIGDSEADVQAGAAAGMKTGLVFPSNRCELCPLRAGVTEISKRAVPDAHAATLLALARIVVSTH